MANNNDTIRVTVTQNYSGVSQQYVDNKVAQEAEARQEAENELKQDYKDLVTAEANTREAENSKLSVRINENETAIQSNKENLATEVQNRGSENKRIEAVVEANKQTADSNIVSVNKSIEAKEKELKGLIEAEKVARQESEAEIYGYINSQVAGAIKYVGTVATVDYLPKTGQKQGDMYNVEADGQNYAWTGYKWDSLGPLVNLKPLQDAIAELSSKLNAVSADLNTRTFG